MEILKDSPMIVTVDEINFIKTWDIRDFRCVQTLHYDFKGHVQYIFNISSELFMMATQHRFHWFIYESKLSTNRNGIEIYGVLPSDIQYNSHENEIVVST